MHNNSALPFSITAIDSESELTNCIDSLFMFINIFLFASCASLTPMPRFHALFSAQVDNNCALMNVNRSLQCGAMARHGVTESLRLKARLKQNIKKQIRTEFWIAIFCHLAIATMDLSYQKSTQNMIDRNVWPVHGLPIKCQCFVNVLTTTFQTCKSFARVSIA